ncbi:transporter substrate-binding domain-containing diguanylate cyclase [Clostridium magnum]|uniref:transporter substrate-binding domain-containing diguanylate cyclase n=1 Tax=Clostridium magnum TaxID=33954 RepID=UPI0008367ED8|nr:transporter substrate-binding domain-containing protein [Clostridium magnum]
MKHILRICACLLTFLTIISFKVSAAINIDNPIELSNEEKQWISENKDRDFVLGIDPYSGIEYFKYKGEEKGYLIPLLEIVKKDLALNIKIEASKGWGEVYSGLQSGSVDILLGANETTERKKFMSFTRAINKNAYVIVAKKESNIHTIGDIDKKTVGFMKGDIISEVLPSTYKNINYKQEKYYSQEEGISALNNNEVDAFIMPGGSVVYDYIYRFPELTYAFKIHNITSDMTFSTRKENKLLASILDKEIKYLSSTNKLQELIDKSEIEYNIKIMNLTDKEIEWLKKDGKAVVGVTKDYLPFDYYENNTHKGISGEMIKEISRKTGVKFISNYGDFDSLYEKLTKGEVDVLNMAKTDERLKYAWYTRPFSLERDIIVGRKDSRDVRDIFGLEGKRVAVIKGFWHYEYLKKNLTDVNIIETNNIQESLTMVHKGKADYLIENPTVVRYYTEELQLYDLVEKGITSADSYLYYGVTKNKPELASIIDKVIPLMDIDQLSKIGYEEVPHVNSEKYYKKLIFTIIALAILLIIVILCVIKLIRDLIKERTETELLRQREHFLYIDTLTNVHNRNFFNRKIKETLDDKEYPQTVIVADMNNLKIANDKYGHHVGDELLKLFADILKETCPKESLILRMGGDEFHIILKSLDKKQVIKIIADIREITKERKIILDENEILIPSAAYGYAIRYSSEKSFDELIKIADQRMYIDKNKYKYVLRQRMISIKRTK